MSNVAIRQTATTLRAQMGRGDTSFDVRGAIMGPFMGLLDVTGRIRGWCLVHPEPWFETRCGTVPW